MHPDWLQPGLLVTSIPLVSGLGALTAGLGRIADDRFRSTAVLVPACGLSLIAALAALVSIETGRSPVVFQIGVWLPWHRGGDVPITSCLQWDAVASTWVIVVTIAALLLSLGDWKTGRSDRECQASAPWMMALLCGAQLLVLSGDFIGVVAFWLLTLFAAWQLANAADAGDGPREGSRRLLTNIAGASLPLLLVLSFLPSTFGSFQFAVVLEGAISLSDRPAVRAAVALVSFGAVLAVWIRSAQFPFCNWLLDLSWQSPLASGWASVVGILPTGVYLFIRVSPLLPLAGGVQSLLFGVGCLSMLTCAFLAVTRSTTAGAISAFVSGTIGLVSMGIATPGGVASASYLAASLFIGGAALWVVTGALYPGHSPAKYERRAFVNSGNRGRPARACGFLLAVGLVSGVMGQEAVLQQIWEVAPEAPERAVSGGDSVEAGTAEASSTPLPPLIAPAVVILSQLLLSLALFRRLLSVRTEGPSSHTREPSGQPVPAFATASQSTLRPVIVTAIGLVASPLLLAILSYDPKGDSRDIAMSSAGQLTRIMVPGMVAMLALIALLLAWILYRRGSSWPSLLQRSLGAVGGLTERRFYLDEATDFILTTPLMLWSKIALLIDNSILRSGLLGGTAHEAGAREPRAASHISPDGLVLALFLIAAVVLALLNEG